MVTPQAIMFEPTSHTAVQSSSRTAAAADGVPAAAAETAGAEDAADAGDEREPNDDELQRHRMIAPLDIITSITMSNSLSRDDNRLDDNL